MIAADDLAWDQGMRAAVTRLVEASTDGYYHPYKTFEWPDHLAVSDLWMSRDRLTTAETAEEKWLSRDQLRRLSRWESINFYSSNVRGIRELISEVIQHLYAPGFEIPTPFFHHFGEENEHMWFFAGFCLRYGGKPYPNRTTASGDEDGSSVLNNFIVFSRVLIFEQIVDYFNSRMAADQKLPETVRAIDRRHHQDESRHIAFGCQLVRVLFERLCAAGDAAEIGAARRYVERYIAMSLQQLYNAEAYRDAGVDEPYPFRKRLLADPSRVKAHERIAGRTYACYRRIGVLDPWSSMRTGPA